MNPLLRLFGAKLFLTKRVSGVEKEEKKEIKVEQPSLISLGRILCILVTLSVVLYIFGQPEAGRLVIDLSLAFIGLAVGRERGERSGLSA